MDEENMAEDNVDEDNQEWNKSHPFYDLDEHEFYGTRPGRGLRPLEQGPVLDRGRGNRSVIWEKSSGRELGLF